MTTIECRFCHVELSADIPLSELREDAHNIGWGANTCPDCQNEMDSLR